MIRKMAVLTGLLLAFGVAAHAQDSDKIEAYGGYSFLHISSNGSSINQNGWELAGQYKVNDWLGAVADFSGDYGSNTNTTFFLFGPQVSWHARVSPFAHFLIGGVHVSNSSTLFIEPPVAQNVTVSSNSFAFGFGGGIDAQIKGPFYWRVFQGDYLHSSVFNSGQNNARFSTGIVIKF